MGNRPYKIPCPVDKIASDGGILYKMIASKTAIQVAIMLAQCPFIFFMINAQKIKAMGKRAAMAEKKIFPSGSIGCVHFMIVPDAERCMKNQIMSLNYSNCNNGK